MFLECFRICGIYNGLVFFQWQTDKLVGSVISPIFDACLFSLFSDRFFPAPSLFTLFFSDILCQAAKVESAIAEGGASRLRYTL